MVEFGQVALSAVAGQVAARAFYRVLGPMEGDERSLRLDRSIDELISVPGESNSTIGVVTYRQSEDIKEFLDARQIASLCESYMVFRLLAEDDEVDGMCEGVKATFERLANEWCDESRSESWESLASPFWALIARYLDGVVERLSSISSFETRRALVEAQTEGSYMSELLSGSRSQGGVDSHLRVLSDLLRNPGRYTRVRHVVNMLQQAMQKRYQELAMTQVQDDHRFLDSQLYVRRTIKHSRAGSSATEASRDATVEDLVALHIRARLVVIGDPGVGKSTLIGHLSLLLSRDNKGGIAPIVVLCKELGAASREVSIAQHICDRLDVEHSVKIRHHELSDLLTLGNACVIFDGVDEVLDLAQRRDMIRRIESFCSQYPAISLVATCRKVGYSEARFASDFEIGTLAEFSEAQFEEYVQKWFSLTGRDEVDLDAFLSESRSLLDIRYNPLMLSLLCALYQARGYLPRNRRLVYKECADLLFTRWDSARRIEQPTEHRQHGTYLMHEIALFYFRNAGAQSGFGETQLVGVIARFFENTAGLDRAEAMSRANLFLKFCAGRAWLLSKLGSSPRGERLYGFTHRTFMEFYAAEALVRRNERIDDLVTVIDEVYRENPASVVPDVMVQAIDERVERGAEKVFHAVVKLGKMKGKEHLADSYLALCLRTANVCAMSRGVTRVLASVVLDFWNRAGRIERSKKSAIALFELHRDVRSRIVDELSSNDAEELRYQIARRWIHFELLEGVVQFESEWADAMGDLIRGPEGQAVGPQAVSNEILSREFPDPTVIDYMLLHGYIGREVGMGRFQPQLAVQAFEHLAPGSVLRVIVSGLDGEFDLLQERHRELVESYWRTADVHVPFAWASRIIQLLYSDEIGWRQEAYESIVDLVEYLPECRELLLWLAFLDYELHSELRGLSKCIVSILLGRVELASLRKGDRGVVSSSVEVLPGFEQFGAWATQWGRAQMSIVR